MGSLSSELAALAERYADGPRVYADANVPAGIVEFMRARLKWDVFFVMEHDELRRAPTTNTSAARATCGAPSSPSTTTTWTTGGVRRHRPPACSF